MTSPRVGGASDNSNACSLDRSRPGVCGAGGLTQDLGGGERGVFGGAAAGQDHRLSRLERRSDLRREACGGESGRASR